MAYPAAKPAAPPTAPPLAALENEDRPGEENVLEPLELPTEERAALNPLESTFFG